MLNNASQTSSWTWTISATQVSRRALSLVRSYGSSSSSCSLFYCFAGRALKNSDIMDGLLGPFLELVGLFSLALVFIYYKFIRRDPHAEKYLDQFPGPPTKPIVGNALELAVKNYELLFVTRKWHAEYKGSFRVWLANQGRLMMTDASLVEKVLTSSVHIDKSMDYDQLLPWLNTGLLTSSGNKWFSRRKLLTPSFHFKILDEFLEVFNEQAEVLVQVLKEERSDSSTPFDVFPYLTRCALDIISETAMGRKINAQRAGETEYVRSIYQIGELVIYRMLRPWLHPQLLWKLSGNEATEKRYLKILHGFTDQAIKDRKQIRASNSGSQKSPSPEDESAFTQKKRLAFLDLLLDVADEGRVLSDADIREETDTFMFEGHDTTAANLCWTVFCLGSNPEAMKKVQEELDSIFGQDRSRDITKEDLSQMKYLDCCIKESLRLFPSVPLFARQIKQDIQLDDGRRIPAGTSAVIFTFYLHRDEKYFPNPDEFQPSRFFPENANGRNPYAYVPFSAGPRNCIGQKFAVMEEKVVLAKLFLNFSFEACELVQDMRLVPDLILRPLDGITVKMAQRN